MHTMDMESHAQTERARAGEQVFFDDPAIDRLLGVVMALAADYFVLKDRVRALEAQLARSGFVDPAAIASEPTGPEAGRIAAQAGEFAAALLAPVLGRQESASVSGKLSLRAPRRTTK